MVYTNFPNGVTSFGVPLVGSGNIPVTNGDYYFVCNRSGAGGSDGNPGTDMAAPLATLQRAIDLCTASNGDVIVILPGHAESVASATALLFNKAGVTIVGQGTGSSRPTFTFTTANTAKIPVSAANIKVQNCIFVGNFLSIATCFLLTAAPGFWVDSCEFRDTSAVLGFLSIITTTVSVDADGLTFTNNTRKSLATTSPGPDIVIAGTIDRVTVVGNTSWHQTISNNVAALIAHGALVVSNLNCGYNKIFSVNTDSATGALLLTTSATTGSGMIYNNYVACLDTAAPLLITAAAVQYFCFNNYVAGDVGLSGYLLPAAGTAS
jgi:hypothetical protein